MNADNIIAVRPGKRIYREGDALIKMFDPTIFPKSDILNEALNHARVEETGLKIPKIRSVDISGDNYIIEMDYIEGKTLQQLMDEDTANYKKYVDRMIDLQLKMHSMQCPLLNKLKDKMTRKISQTGLSATTRYELQTRLESMPKHTKLCHGDFNPTNIICAKDGDYIVDWSHATQGNASADVARTYLLFSLEGKNEIANYYLNTFCLKSDTPKQYVQKWLPIVAASQSVKGNPDERSFLLRWVDIAEYQ